MQKITRVMGANGTPVDVPGLAEVSEMMEGIDTRLRTLKVTPAMMQGFSSNVSALLDADSQQGIRDAAGIGAEMVAVKGDPGESPLLAVSDEKLQYRLPSQQNWTELFNFETLRPLPAKDGENGKDGIDGKGIESVYIQYQLSSSGETPPSGQWRSESLPAAKGMYLWSRVVINPTAGSQQIAYLVSYSGNDGKDGESIKGEPGLSVQGPPGVDGKDGLPGKDGKDGTNATTAANATTTASGLMSPADKSKLDSLSSASVTSLASGGRLVGTPFVISATRNALVSYTLSYQLTATLVVGQTITISATVDGVEVGRVTDGMLLGLAGTLQKSQVLSFMVPAGKEVKLVRTGTSGVTATVISGQETLL